MAFQLFTFQLLRNCASSNVSFVNMFKFRFSFFETNIKMPLILVEMFLIVFKTFSERKLEFLKLLLDNHADPNQRGWVRIQSRFRNWTPLELSIHFQKENPTSLWRQINNCINSNIQRRSDSFTTHSWTRFLFRRIVLFCVGE